MMFRSKTLRATVPALLLALVGAFGLAGQAQAATLSPQASGGGCSSNLAVTSCISYNILLNVVANSYYNGTPPAGCTHTTLIEDGYGDVVAQASGVPCSSGSNTGTAVGTFGGDFIAYSCYFKSNGTLIACAYSPWQYV